MKELTIKVYSFDELPKEAQDKIIERERWDVMDNAMIVFSILFTRSMSIGQATNRYEKSCRHEKITTTKTAQSARAIFIAQPKNGGSNPSDIINQ